MLLTTLVDEIADARDIEKITIDQYRRSVRCFSARLGRPATTDDLVESVVNKWLRSLQDVKAASTILGRKRGLTALWNFAAERGLAEYYNPRKLRRIRMEYPPVVPWSVDQVRILCTACDLVEGRLRSGIEASTFLAAMVRFHFETGLRPSDVRIVRWESVDLGSRRVAFAQHKTRKPHVASFSELTAGLLARIQTEDPRVFPLSKSSIRQWEKKLWIEAAKLGFRRRKGQALGYNRKSHGTEVARQQGVEAAARSLGHVSGTLTAMRHYIAVDALGPPPTPPSLDDAKDNSQSGTRTRPADPRHPPDDRDRRGRDRSAA